MKKYRMIRKIQIVEELIVTANSSYEARCIAEDDSDDKAIKILSVIDGDYEVSDVEEIK